MNKNKKIILSLVLIVTLVIGLGVGIKLNNKKYEDKKQDVVESHMEIRPDEKFDVEIIKIKNKKMVVYYDYIEFDDMDWLYESYKYLSNDYSDMFYTYQNEKDVDVVHVYLSKDLTIHFISMNGINVYENGDIKEGNEYYEEIYNTIFEKTLGGKIKEL